MQLKSGQVLHLFSTEGKFLYTSLNKKDFLEVSLCRCQPSVFTTKYRPGSPRSANLMHVNSGISMVIREFVHCIISSKYHGCFHAC